MGWFDHYPFLDPPTLKTTIHFQGGGGRNDVSFNISGVEQFIVFLFRLIFLTYKWIGYRL